MHGATIKISNDIGLPKITGEEYNAFPPDPPIPQTRIHSSDGVAK